LSTPQYDPVLMPLIRRVWPQIIANDIIGVQPMTSWIKTSIFSPKAKFKYDNEKVRMKREKYNTFVRVYNRKKHVTREDFYRANYPWVDADLKQDWGAMHEWCKNSFGKNNYVWFGERFFFVNEDQKALFIYAGWALIK